MLKKLLFKIAKASFMGSIVGTAFQYCSWAVPVRKLSCSKEILAFRHPQPSYENHIILSPKRAVKNLQQLSSDDYCSYFAKIWEAAKDTGSSYLHDDSFTLVANGGKRQEVQQVHFHLFTNHEFVNEYTTHEPPENIFFSDKSICVVKHPDANWEIHFVIIPAFSSIAADTNLYFKSILRTIDLLNAEFHIVQKGYSLVHQHSSRKGNTEYPIFHIVSGKRIN